MITAKDVADFLIDTSKDGVTQLKLMKLLYFAQVWHMIEFSEPLFLDSFQAWEYGPVIPKIREDVYQHGTSSIPRPETVDYSKFSDEQIDLLTDLVVYFEDTSPGKMIDLTHEDGSPWEEAYSRSRNSEIDINLLADFHKEKHYSRLNYIF